MDVQVTRRDVGPWLAQAILKMDNLDHLCRLTTEMVKSFWGLSWVSLALEEGLVVKDKITSRRQTGDLAAQPQVSLPLSVNDQSLGSLNLGEKINGENFSPEELELLTQLSEILSPIVYQALELDRAKKQRLRHQNILDNLVSGIIAVDPRDKITVFNRAAERILNLKADEVLGKNARSLQANLAELLLDTLRNGHSYRRKEVSILPDNLLIGVSSSQFYDAGGNLLGACMVFSGLGDIKREEKLTRQQNMDTYWSTVANSLAHEVKNSIVATKVFAEMFPQKYEDAQFRWSLYATLKRDMEKLDNFVDRVLTFARPQQLSRQLCQIEQILQAASEAAFEGRQLTAIGIEKRYAQDLKPFSGDYQQLKEAFTEIIGNALEAMAEIGQMSLASQARIFRAVEQQEIIRLGGVKALKLDTRIIASTSGDLKQAVKEGKFHPDLYRRLSQTSITVIPLRERKEDIPLLAKHFLEKHRQRLSSEVKEIAPEALKALANYHWPGNLRELENIIERLLILVKRPSVLAEDLPPDIRAHQAIGR